MRSAIDNFHRQIRKAARDIGLGVLAVAVGDKPTGGSAIGQELQTGEAFGLYSAANLSPEQLDFAAQAVLDLVIQQGGDPSCPCCTDRVARATAALAAMRAMPAEPIDKLH